MSNPVISLSSHGSVRGTIQDYPVQGAARRYVNIPYALPPTEERRWAKPTPLPADFNYNNQDGSPRDCTNFGDICHQPSYIVNGRDMGSVEGSKHSENCLILNIWTPAHDPPSGHTWPVFVWIHGGWLQMGNASFTERHWPEGLLSKDKNGAGLEAVVVSIGYRLNILGFLAGKDIPGNYAFWDQRCALQWIQKYIHFFGGDPKRVTLGGQSAGAFSTHCQLQYELFHTDGSEPLFSNVFLCSNAIPAQPKSLTEANEQLEDVLQHFKIPSNISQSERLDQLRKFPGADLIDSFPNLQLHTFRAVTDNDFIHEDMTKKFQDGTFARIFKERGMRLLIGEAENEQWLYSKVLPPKTLSDLPHTLENYYAADICKRLLALPQYQVQSGPNEDVEAVRMYGLIAADVQVRAPIRLLCHQLLVAGVPSDRICRYRFAYRPGCLDKYYPKEAGVTHAADLYSWYLTRHCGITNAEVDVLKPWLQGTILNLINGKPFTYTSDKEDQYFLFGEDGKIILVDDKYWNELVKTGTEVFY